MPSDVRAKPVSVGIVTRTKNRAVLLRRALESVKGQTFGNWSLVVVNDGGEPGPVDSLVAAIFGAQDPRVRVIHHAQSKGMEAASNAGLATLDTTYAIIHDDDDSWAPEFLSVMTSVITAKRAQFPSVKGIVCRLNAVFENVTANHVQIERVEPWFASAHDRIDEGFISIQKMLVRNQFPPIAFLFDLAACKDLGMFDASLPVLGDWDFHARFVLKHDIWAHPEFSGLLPPQGRRDGGDGKFHLCGAGCPPHVQCHPAQSACPQCRPVRPGEPGGSFGFVRTSGCCIRQHVTESGHD